MVVVVAATACSPATWNRVDVTTMITSNAMLAADAVYTTTVAGDRWPNRDEEVGMARVVLGRTPSPAAVDLYFFSAIAINTVLWAVLPPRWRSVIPGLLIGAQAEALAIDYGGCFRCPSF